MFWWSRRNLGPRCTKILFQTRDYSNKVLFIHNILITDFIQYPLLLERDLTGSLAKFMQTNYYLFLPKAQNNFQSRDDMITDDKVADILNINHFSKKLPLSKLYEFLILSETIYFVNSVNRCTIDLRPQLLWATLN